VDEVVDQGLGLAFVAFPAIISEAPGGAVIGVLFFGSLVVAGLTSLVSVIEVVISAVRDKFDLGRVSASLAVGVPAAVVSILAFATTTGVPILDTMDHFINRFGILLAAVVSMLVVAWGFRELPVLRQHMNATGSLQLGRWWVVLIAAVTPAALTFVLVREFIDTVSTPYGEYPGWLLATFGWGTALVVIGLAVLITLIPWNPRVTLKVPENDPQEEPS
jgi:NSS family neurotransmitter:Na+ symporter